MKKATLIVALLMAVVILLSGCGGSPAADGQSASSDSDVKVAVVFSTLGDLNFNDWGMDGAVMARDELGVEFDYVECPTVSDAETQINMFAMDGAYDLIIVLGSDRKDITEDAALSYPEQDFALIDSSVTEGIDNLSGARANFPEWAFLSGVVSGLVTIDERMPLANGENIIGFAGGADSPVSRAGAAGYLAGAKYVNPEVEIIYTIVGSYTDPNRAKEIAMTTYGRGADIMSVNCGSSAMGVYNAAEELDKYFISTSLALVSETNSLCTSITRFDLLVYREIEAKVSGTWEAGNRVSGIKEGTCDISFEGTTVEIPQDILDIVEDVRQQIINGEIEFPNDPDEIEEWSKTYRYFD